MSDDQDVENNVIYPDSTRGEMLDWLLGNSRDEIIAVCQFVNARTAHKWLLRESGTKGDLVGSLSDVPKSVLWKAIDHVFPDSDEDSDNDDLEPPSKSIQRLPTDEVAELLEFFNKPEDKYEFRQYQQDATKAITRAINSRPTKGTVNIGTGGGKNRVTNDAIHAFITANPDQKVLWISKEWLLLYQAAADLNRRHQALQLMGRIGGANRELAFLPETSDSTQVTYTTIQTYAARAKHKEIGSDYDIIIIDESHWGQSGPMYRKLIKQFGGKATIIGLTGTPRGEDHFPVIYKKTFVDLVREGQLAKPEIREPKTGIAWAPDLVGGTLRKIRSESYRKLASNINRNKEIVDEFIRHRRDYGKTLVFAVDIFHCEELLAVFSRAGIPADTVHSQKPQAENRSAISKFKKGLIDVLINVEKMTTGVDIPEIKTLFLTRPTESEILFSQMIGRGARRTEGKTFFYIIEFTDNVTTHKDILVTSKDLFSASLSQETFKDTEPVARSSDVKKRFPREMLYDPASTFEYFQSTSWDGSPLQVPIKSGQTFGLEFELTTVDSLSCLSNVKLWMPKAEALVQRLETILGRDRVYSEPQWEERYEYGYEKYRIVKDGSCGWEIVSPILRGQSGMQEVERLLKGLNSDEFLQKNGFKLNYETGTHLHLGFQFPALEELRQLLHTIRYLEPFISLLVSPSRVCEFVADNEYRMAAPNPYCVSWSQAVSAEWIEKLRSVQEFESRLSRLKLPGQDISDARYMTVNMTNLLTDETGGQTVEVRFLNGTLDYRNVVSWISLWMQLLETSRSKDIATFPRERRDTHIPIPQFEHFDLFSKALNYYLSNPSETFINHLLHRVGELQKRWTLVTGSNLEKD